MINLLVVVVYHGNDGAGINITAKPAQVFLHSSVKHNIISILPSGIKV